MVIICIASFEAIGELQRKRLRQSCAALFSWNARMHGTIPPNKELNTFVTPSSSSTWSVVSDKYLLYGRSPHTLQRLV